MYHYDVTVRKGFAGPVVLVDTCSSRKEVYDLVKKYREEGDYHVTVDPIKVTRQQ